jgi:hypothetical protein
MAKEAGMSLTNWTIFYIASLLLGGWFLSRDREMRKESSGSVIWLIVILITTFWFVVGLIFPEVRFFIVGQPS